MTSQASSGQGAQGASDVTADLLRRLSERSARRDRGQDEGVSSQRWSYREAAAVLHCFDPARLHPRDASLRVDDPRSLLAADTQPTAGGREHGFLTLKIEPRREALQRLGNRESLSAALAANPERPMTDVQRMLERWLKGTAPELANQSAEELNQTQQVVAWLGGIVAGLPAAEQVREHLSRRAPLRRFEHLVTKDFVGREKELAQLRHYVGVLPPSSLREAANRQLRAWLTLERRPPLLLFGPGGVGKSALVGRFLWEHSQASDALRFPFAYLPFDDPLLVIREPYTLLVDAAQQLAQQYPDNDRAHATFRAVLERYSRGRAGLAGLAAASPTRGAKLGAVGGLDDELVSAFGSLLRDLAAQRQPALFVLDTFEQVQYRPRTELRGLGLMLVNLQRSFPLLRVVASGRAPARELELSTEELELGDLEPASAIRLLVMQGVTDEGVAATVARQLGGNPLTLRLAAEALRSQPDMAGAEGLAGISTRRYWIFSVSPALVQGQLYRRILDHIRDAEVRKLAHPGMVLRRVTPALIREVLAVPCGVAVPDEEAANRLFRSLQQEHALVRLEDSQTLQFRPEVRQPMLRLLESEAPAKVRDIHRRAYRFWAASDEPFARVEELYHRLALDQDPGELEERQWLPELGPALAAVREELPPRAAAWLSSYFGLALGPELVKAASQADWERSIGREATAALRHQAVERALELLAGRAGRLPGSALYPLAARAHLLVSDADAARAVLEQGLASMPITGNPGRQCEMLWLHAQAAAALGDHTGAVGSLAQAEIVARRIPDRLCRLQILAQQLILVRRVKGLLVPASTALRARLAETLIELDSEQMDREPTLLRVAAAELQPEHLPALERVVNAVGLGTLPPAAEQALRANLQLDPSEALDRVFLAASAERRAAIGKIAIARAVLTALRAAGLTLDAANLAGIEQYREQWEREFASEAFA